MLAFCGNGTHLTEPWVNEGFSLCFYETVTSSIIFGFMMLFGITQICVYRRFSTNRDPRDIPFSRLYRLQITLSITMLFVVLLRIALEATAIGDHQVYIYQMMSTTFNTLVWPVSLIVMWQERHYVLPSIPTRGHGLVLLIFWASVFVCENMAFISWFSPQWWWRERNDAKNTELGLWTVRYICSAVLFGLGFAAPGIPKHTSLSIQADDVEALLGESSGSDGQRQQERSTWSNVFQKMKLLWPSVWPKKSPFLQFLVIMCLILLGLGRVCNLFTPIYYKKIVDSLTIKSTANESEAYTLTAGTFSFRWDYVLVYIVLRFLQGGGLGTMGLLNNMRSLLWIKVQQYTTREIGVDLYSHLHSLSLRWHLSRKTGEVLRVMDRGTNSINQLLSYILFQIAPTIIDISVAIIYFLTAFNAWFALIVFATMALFLTSTIIVTEWRTKFRREMNKLDNLRNAKGVDSLINFETVKYYGAESFEVERYRKAVVDYQKQEWVSTASLNLLNTIQNFIITGGFAAGAMLSVYYVANDLHGLTVGDFVLFSTYIMQLYTPLNWLGTYYRMIQQAFIDMENMFDLLSEEQEVKDIPGADDLQMTKGYIEFSNVTFHYEPSKPILKGVSFFVPPGQTIALVGPSGSGKSTIIRLLFRFYDVQGGFIKFDGQDITTVTQKSLRQAIGVVPQDTVLFNDDIRYNIRYGRVTASDEDLENSAIAADIHERILGFTDGYQTKVGERGLKLSGGEKQRVAIARTILKAPQIVLLDEATSALDTQTERNIQTSLARVCENRTTIIVAHRLSTIIHADQILVLKDGEILERGRHDELLAQEGMYANMWQQQLTKNEDMESSGEGSSGEHSKPDVKHQ